MGERMIRAESIIAIKQGISTAEVDDEIAMIDAEQGKYYGFDSVASRIWRLIQEPKPFESIIEALMNEYDVSRQQCEEDVSELFERLYEEGLISIS